MSGFERENVADHQHPQPLLTPFAVSVEEAERLTSIGRSKLYELMQRGRIKSRKVGRRRLVILASLRSFVEGEDA